jgi:hypothetical protein
MMQNVSTGRFMLSDPEATQTAHALCCLLFKDHYELKITFQQMLLG